MTTYFVDDPYTTVIGLLLEKIRTPNGILQGCSIEPSMQEKPIVALKLGQSERAQRMAASHTGALIGDAWVYDMAFEQAGIQVASDLEDLVDRVQLLEQLSPAHWSPVNGLAELTMTGGSASLLERSR